MKEAIEQLLPLIKMGKVADAAIQDIIDKILVSIKEDPSKGKELGELFSRIKQASKEKNHHAAIAWVQVDKGFIAIGHKPGGKISFEGLKTAGTSVVLTLLNENEGAAAIGKQVSSVNIDWIWFPFSASRPHEGEGIAQVRHLYTRLSGLIAAGARVYIHCSAGIHRTGMITYGFLRFLGKGKTEAFEILRSLREVTAAQVGEARLQWADQFANKNNKQ